MRRIFVGYDTRQELAYRVCEHSLDRRSSTPLDIFPLRHKALRGAKLFTREWDGFLDKVDNKPFSTEFSHTRFLVPEICRLNEVGGWVLFCDSDFLFLDDVENLFKYGHNKEHAVCVVKHNYEPETKVKMDNKEQHSYTRKLWSSLILWNMDHPANKALTPHVVNTESGRFMHTFSWLKDEEIGGIPENWNWLPNHSPTTRWYNEDRVRAVHYTEGGPWFADYTNIPFAEQWLAEKTHLEGIRLNQRIKL